MKHKAENTVITTQNLNYYPAFLNLNKKNVIVCGGGKVAERKILSIIKTGANITVISPEITKRILKEKQNNRIRHISRQYRKGDLNDAFLVIAATDSMRVNERISKEVSSLINVVDTPHLCNFIVPSVVKRGPLTIAISTSGISPALSKAIRKELQKLYESRFSNYLNLLKRYRTQVMYSIKDQRKRRRFLKEVASEKVIKILRKKGLKETEKVLKEIFENYGKIV